MTDAHVRWLTAAQVARAYGVDVETVREWMRKGIIAYVKVGPFNVKRIAESEARRHFTPVHGART